MGVLAGLSAYGLWGVLPLYLHSLAPAGAWEIVCLRIVLSLIFCALVLAVTGRLRRFVESLRDRRRLGLLALAGVLVGVNWLLYVFAVGWGRVSDAALGYFLNPLVSIALGVFFLGERLRRLQWVAVGLGLTGAVVMAAMSASSTWIALGLAFSFGLYGFVKNRVGRTLPAVDGLAAETLILTLPAVVGLVLIGRGPGLTFGTGVAHTVLLSLAGVVTAVPLILFAAAAARVPLSTLGLMQFLAPVLQLLTAIGMGEQVSAGRWVAFGIVWAALAVLIYDTVAATRARAGGAEHVECVETP